MTGPVSEQRPARTIYGSAAGAATAPAADPSPARPRRLRDAWWLAPVLALVVLFAAFVVASFFLLGGVGLLQYFGVDVVGPEVRRRLGSSDTALGTAVIHITKSGGAYTIAGARTWAGPPPRRRSTTTPSWRPAPRAASRGSCRCRLPTATSSTPSLPRATAGHPWRRCSPDSSRRPGVPVWFSVRESSRL